MKPRVSVVIPNYNGAEYLENCLLSLGQQTMPGMEIIVVDDASEDDSAKALEERYPAVRFLFHETNGGFCKSCNDGVKAAKAPYVILLNNDTTCHKDFAKALYKAIRRSPKIFSAQAKMVSMQNPEVLDDAGDGLTIMGWAFAPGKDKPAERLRKKKHIFSACGGAAIYRKDVYLALGGLDEVHFAYFEDVDLGYRAKLQGYVNISVPAAVVYHAGSASSGSRYNAFKARYSGRNNFYFLWKNMPLWQLLLNGQWIFLGFFIKSIFYIKKGLGKEYLAGLWEGMKLTKEHRDKKVDFHKVPIRNVLKVQVELYYWTIRRICG
ncbi:MAG: glycosyltransferase family 2 protein [Lachnospiraceae bacterium]|nr:glycosyltransferase family 2 protein [Lachnospiraceae bacterium]